MSSELILIAMKFSLLTLSIFVENCFYFSKIVYLQNRAVLSFSQVTWLKKKRIKICLESSMIQISKRKMHLLLVI